MPRRSPQRLLFLLSTLSLACSAWAVIQTAYGDMPHRWARQARVYEAAQVGDADYLAEVLGCALLERMREGRSMQCGETFLWIGPAAAAELALGAIGNVQAEGYVREARVFTGNAGTRGNGRIERAVIYDGSCYGNVGDCVGLRTGTIEFENGWQLRSVSSRLELIGPDGTLRDVWN